MRSNTTGILLRNISEISLSKKSPFLENKPFKKFYVLMASPRTRRVLKELKVKDGNNVGIIFILLDACQLGPSFEMA